MKTFRVYSISVLVLGLMASVGCDSPGSNIPLGKSPTPPTPPANQKAIAMKSIIPDHGTILGGTSVSIFGSNFSSDTTVELDGISCEAITVTRNRRIDCTTPVFKKAGKVDVVVKKPGGESVTLTEGFTVNLPPVTLTQVSLQVGDVVGGYPITLTGTGFVTGVTEVKIGGISCSVTQVQGHSITCTVPKVEINGDGVQVSVDITVSNSATLVGTLVRKFTFRDLQKERSKFDEKAHADIKQTQGAEGLEFKQLFRQFQEERDEIPKRIQRKFENRLREQREEFFFEEESSRDSLLSEEESAYKVLLDQKKIEFEKIWQAHFRGFHLFGFNSDGTFLDTGRTTNAAGFDIHGNYANVYPLKNVDSFGYSLYGFNENGEHRNGTNLDEYLFDVHGQYKGGQSRYDELGFDRDGFHEKTKGRFDEHGLDRAGFRQDGTFLDSGKLYDAEGFDQYGFNDAGFNRNGLNKRTGWGFTGRHYDIDGIHFDDESRNGDDDGSGPAVALNMEQVYNHWAHSKAENEKRKRYALERAERFWIEGNILRVLRALQRAEVILSRVENSPSREEIPAVVARILANAKKFSSSKRVATAIGIRTIQHERLKTVVAQRVIEHQRELEEEKETSRVNVRFR